MELIRGDRMPFAKGAGTNQPSNEPANPASESTSPVETNSGADAFFVDPSLFDDTFLPSTHLDLQVLDLESCDFSWNCPYLQQPWPDNTPFLPAEDWSFAPALLVALKQPPFLAEVQAPKVSNDWDKPFVPKPSGPKVSDAWDQQSAAISHGKNPFSTTKPKKKSTTVTATKNKEHCPRCKMTFRCTCAKVQAPGDPGSSASWFSNPLSATVQPFEHLATSVDKMAEKMDKVSDTVSQTSEIWATRADLANDNLSRLTNFVSTLIENTGGLAVNANVGELLTTFVIQCVNVFTCRTLGEFAHTLVAILAPYVHSLGKGAWAKILEFTSSFAEQTKNVAVVQAPFVVPDAVSETFVGSFAKIVGGIFSYKDFGEMHHDHLRIQRIRGTIGSVSDIYGAAKWMYSCLLEGIDWFVCHILKRPSIMSVTSLREKYIEIASALEAIIRSSDQLVLHGEVYDATAKLLETYAEWDKQARAYRELDHCVVQAALLYRLVARAFDAAKNNSKIHTKPVVCRLTGPSNIGKSYCFEFIAAYCASRLGLPCERDQLIFKDPSGDFKDGYEGQCFYCFDDADQDQRPENATSKRLWLIDLCQDTYVPMEISGTGKQAKGYTFFCSPFIGITTNDSRSKSPAQIQSDTAYRRRIWFDIDVSLKPGTVFSETDPDENVWVFATRKSDGAVMNYSFYELCECLLEANRQNTVFRAGTEEGLKRIAARAVVDLPPYVPQVSAWTRHEKFNRNRDIPLAEQGTASPFAKPHQAKFGKSILGFPAVVNYEPGHHPDSMAAKQQAVVAAAVVQAPTDTAPMEYAQRADQTPENAARAIAKDYQPRLNRQQIAMTRSRYMQTLIKTLSPVIEAYNIGQEDKDKVDLDALKVLGLSVTTQEQYAEVVEVLGQIVKSHNQAVLYHLDPWTKVVEGMKFGAAVTASVAAMYGLLKLVTALLGTLLPIKKAHVLEDYEMVEPTQVQSPGSSAAASSKKVIRPIPKIAHVQAPDRAGIDNKIFASMGFFFAQGQDGHRIPPIQAVHLERNIWLTCRHQILRMEALANPTCHLLMHDRVQGRFVDYRFTLPEGCLIYPENEDLALFTPHSVEPKMPRPPILSNLFAPEDMLKHDLRKGVLLARSIQTGIPMLRPFDDLEKCHENMSFRDGKLYGTSVNTFIYNADSQDGDCAGIVRTDNPHVPYPILGIQYGRVDHRDNPAQGLFITKEMLTILVGYFGKDSAASVQAPPAALFGYDALNLRELDKVFHMSNESPYVRSHFDGEPTRIPPSPRPFLKDGNPDFPVYPLMNAVRASTEQTPVEFHEELLMAAAEGVLLQLPDVHHIRDPLTDEENWSGTGRPYESGIERSTSPGGDDVFVPHSGKSQLFEVVDAGAGLYRSTPEVLARVLSFEQKIRDTPFDELCTLSIPVNVCNKVDETLPREKVLKGKVRDLNVLGIEMQMLLRKYLLRPLACLKAQHGKNFCAIGINPLSANEWTEIAHRHHLDDVDWKHLALDAEKYDKSWRKFMFKIQAHIFSAWTYPDNPEHAEMVGKLVYLLAFRTHRIACYAFEVEGREPTGVSITADINSIGLEHISCTTWLYACLTILKRPLGWDLYLLCIIRDFYGDDSFVSVHQQFTRIYNPQTFSEVAYKFFGIKFTHSIKDRVPDWSEPADINFLKRRFVLHKGFYLAPLDREVVDNMLYWVRKKGDWKENHRALVQARLREEFMYGREAFDSALYLYNSVLRSLKIQPVGLSYGQCVGDWLGGSVEPWNGTLHLSSFTPLEDGAFESVYENPLPKGDGRAGGDFVFGDDIVLVDNLPETQAAFERRLAQVLGEFPFWIREPQVNMVFVPVAPTPRHTWKRKRCRNPFPKGAGRDGGSFRLGLATKRLIVLLVACMSILSHDPLLRVVALEQVARVQAGDDDGVASLNAPTAADHLAVVVSETAPLSQQEDRAKLVIPYPVPEPASLLSAPGYSGFSSEEIGRKYEIGSFAVTSAASVGHAYSTYAFPDILFSQPKIGNILAGYQYFRGDVKVTLMIQATKMVTGVLLADFIPNATSSETISATNPPFSNSFGRHWKIPLDVAPTVELDLRHQDPSNWFRLNSYGSNIGTLRFYQYLPYSNLSSAGTTSLTVTVYAQFIGASVAGPTTADVVLARQADMLARANREGKRPQHTGYAERNQRMLAVAKVQAGPGQATGEQVSKSSGVVSEIADAVTTVSAALTPIPIIGEIAGAVSAISGAVGGVARFFGFDRPVALNTAQQVLLGDFVDHANARGLLQAEVLGMDRENRVADDLATTRAIESETSFVEYLAHPCIFDIFSTSTTTAENTVLRVYPVTPMLGYILYGASRVNCTPTRCMLLATQFAAWRGTIIFTFDVAGSPFMNFRLRFSLIPSETTAPSTVSTSDGDIPHLIVDVAGSKCVKIAVPYNAYAPFLKTGFPQGYIGNNSSETWAGGDDYIAAQLVVSLDGVVNSANTGVTGFWTGVAISAGRDIQFQMPWTDTGLGFTQSFVSKEGEPAWEEIPRMGQVAKVQAGQDTDKPESGDANLVQADAINDADAVVLLDQPSYFLHGENFGELYTDWKHLFRRFVMKSRNATIPVKLQLNPTNMLPGVQLFLAQAWRYWRGSQYVRWVVKTTAASSTQVNSALMKALTYPLGAGSVISTGNVDNQTNNQFLPCAITYTPNTGQQTVMVPWSHRFRYMYVNQGTGMNNIPDTSLLPGLMLTAESLSATAQGYVADIYYALGDDFTLFEPVNPGYIYYLIGTTPDF